MIAVEYLFEEDFSSEPEDWTFVGVNWAGYSGTTGAKVQNHSLSIEDGRLVSNRLIEDTWNWDHAFHPTTLKNGVWQFDAQQKRYTTLPNETSHPHSDYHWTFELTDSDLNFDGAKSSTNLDYSIIIGFREIGDGDHAIIISEENADNWKERAYIRDDIFTENGVDYYFMIGKDENTIFIFINNEEILRHELDPSSVEFNHFGMGTARPISFDNFRVTDDLTILPLPEGENSDDGFVSSTNILITFGSFTIAILSYKYYFSKKKFVRNIINKIWPFNARGYKSNLTNPFQSLFYALMIGSSKSVKEEVDNVIVTNIPLEMFHYKFLMNPIRLAIIKMLHVYGNLTSVEIKNSLELSWGEYHTNIKALESKSYILVKDDFDKKMRRQFVALEKQGREDYIKLMTLLQDFADDPLSLDVTQIQKNINDDDLYPEYK